ncbi:MAG: hypothetical protein GTN59_11175 [Candidatus Dadabacteria bacterium]|nr:hypothetical protein [Candidatus Dadabacteria bacterium]
MARVFDKNMFIMLLSIMIGAIIITYFVADIVSRTKWEVKEEGYKIEIKDIKGKSENFTSLFLKSNVLLDQAREERAFGNYHFDLGFLWYNSALSERNSSIMEVYKFRGIENCTFAMPFYIASNEKFLEAKNYFNKTKKYTYINKYITMLDLYVNLTSSGSNLTNLRYNACKYLVSLTENLTFNFETNKVVYLENVTEILLLFNVNMMAYNNEISNYQEIQDEIDEYEFFDENREIS